MAQCHAHRSNGVDQCKNPAIPGGTVCRYHGGSAPQVRNKALARIQALVEPAIDKYQPLLDCDQPNVVLNTVKEILDRAGYKPVERIEQTNYEASEVEELDALNDEELAQFIALKRKIAESRSSRGVT